jgi:hypothetical protein
MARDDPDQHSYFADADPRDAPPAARDVVIGGEKDDDPGGVGDGGRTPGPGDRDPLTPPTRSRERAPPPPPRETPEANPQEGVDELKRQFDREAQARQRAEQAATQAMQRASVAEARYGQAATGMIDSAMEAASRQSDQAAAKFAAAMDIGDHRTASLAQVEIADARSNLHTLQQQKQMLQEQNAAAARQPQAQPRQQQLNDGDLASANLRNITGELEKTGYRKSADWLRSHPDMVRDKDSINKVDGAHGYVVNVMKIPVESDRYFDEMESILLGNAGDRDYVEPEPRRGDRRPAVRQAAPVRNQAPRLRDGQSRRTVHLTSEQRAHARDVLGMTDEEYAIGLADAEDRGKLLKGHER